MTPELILFGCGFFGSAVVELLVAVKSYQGAPSLPVRYRKVGYWVVRSLLAVSGGIFALLYKPENLILAVHIGASTPLIIGALSSSLPDDVK